MGDILYIGGEPILTQPKSNAELLDHTFICYHMGQFGEKRLREGVSMLRRNCSG